MKEEIDSRYLSYILRHKPEKANITLDKYGWADVSDLCTNLGITKAELDKIVFNNTRFIYNNTQSLIKAAHGHSVPVAYTSQAIPPMFLYHGTADRFMKSIKSKGLLPMTRRQVHLSDNKDKAREIGLRHVGNSKDHVIVIEIDTDRMLKDNFKFYKSEDGVWMVDKVPSKYFKILLDK